MNEKICVSEMMNAHGVRGLVRIKLFVEDSLFRSFAECFDENGKAYKLHLKSKVKGQWLAEIEGIKDRTDAEELKATKLYVGSDLFPKNKTNEFYQKDLIGCNVIDQDGKAFGKLKSFYPRGEDEHMIEIQTLDKKFVYLIFDKKSVLEINLKESWIQIDNAQLFDAI